LASIRSLKHLVSIDGRLTLDDDDEDPWDRQLFPNLETAHPKLTKIFIGGFAWVQVSEDGLRSWQKRIIPKFTSWDLVTGVYDRV